MPSTVSISDWLYTSHVSTTLVGFVRYSWYYVIHSRSAVGSYRKWKHGDADEENKEFCLEISFQNEREFFPKARFSFSLGSSRADPVLYGIVSMYNYSVLHWILPCCYHPPLVLTYTAHHLGTLLWHCLCNPVNGETPAIYSAVK